MPPEDTNILLPKQDPLERNDIPQDDDFDEDKALSSNDKDSQEENSDHTYNSTQRWYLFWLKYSKEMSYLLIIEKGYSRTFHEIDRQLSQKLPKDIKATNKILSKISYHILATFKLLDYLFKTLYNTKPAENKKEALKVWTILEQSMLAARSLLLDSLSHTIQVRRDLAINTIIPSHQPRAKHDKLFETTTTTKQTRALIQTSIEAEVEDSIKNLELQVIGKIFGLILHKGKEELAGGCCIQVEARMSRLVNSEKFVQENQSVTGTMQYRPVCKQVQQNVPEVLFPYFRQKSSDYKCIATSMERMQVLDKPSLNINTESFKQSNSKKSDNNFGLFSVANDTLVFYFISPSSRSPSYNFTELNHIQLLEIE
ncbi:26893_t:CDS:2 [Dentiscutata erythropus]|uniref:26893_t:CDS:1 n=1 Tax=Dentiscutata erythropus TaxID=1348616 RepID=A0A9N9GXI0_9GLOM|nr:26893_t:CDS:2 [Dentiscutata erythropus]